MDTRKMEHHFNPGLTLFENSPFAFTANTLITDREVKKNMWNNTLSNATTMHCHHKVKYPIGSR
jgi:hypothetical protein